MKYAKPPVDVKITLRTARFNKRDERSMTIYGQMPASMLKKFKARSGALFNVTIAKY
jgi:hypothetical protein